LSAAGRCASLKRPKGPGPAEKNATDPMTPTVSTPVEGGRRTATDIARRSILFLFGFAAPIDTTVILLATVLLVLLWLAEGGWRRTIGVIRHEPVGAVALALFGLFVIGTLYAPIPWSDTLATLKKYRELALIPIAIACCRAAADRRAILYGFVAAVGLNVALSYVEATGAINVGRQHEDTGLQHRIVFGTFAALAAFWAAHRAGRVANRQVAMLLGLLAVAAAASVLGIAASRTGYAILAALALLFAFQRYGGRGLLGGIVMVALLGALAYAAVPRFASKIDQTRTELIAFDQGEPGGSAGSRLGDWRQSLAVVGAAPVFGHGTGGFPPAFAELSGEARPPAHPHNEYLMIASQLGVVGLGVFLWLLWCAWRSTRRMPADDALVAQGVVVAFALTCLFNSALLNSPEGHAFAALIAAFWTPAGGRS